MDIKTLDIRPHYFENYYNIYCQETICPKKIIWRNLSRCWRHVGKITTWGEKTTYGYKLVECPREWNQVRIHWDSLAFVKSGLYKWRHNWLPMFLKSDSKNNSTKPVILLFYICMNNLLYFSHHSKKKQHCYFFWLTKGKV